MIINAEHPIPILRIFDEIKATEFYLGFLGFKIDWQHRFESNTPLYMQISLNNCILHISEHFGDSCPGGHIRVEIENLDEFCKHLNDKNYRHSKPGYQLMPWGTLDMSIDDPFGNRITFYSRI